MLLSFLSTKRGPTVARVFGPPSRNGVGWASGASAITGLTRAGSVAAVNLSAPLRESSGPAALAGALTPNYTLPQGNCKGQVFYFLRKEETRGGRRGFPQSGRLMRGASGGSYTVADEGKLVKSVR